MHCHVQIVLTLCANSRPSLSYRRMPSRPFERHPYSMRLYRPLLNEQRSDNRSDKGLDASFSWDPPSPSFEQP